MQDILAVLFLVLAAGKVPHLWALGLLLLPLLRPLLHRLVLSVGYGEMLPLAGLFLALAGSTLFDVTGVKGDLGALVAGMLLSGTRPADSLYKSLIAFKDIFLIGFFLSIGFSAMPDMVMLGEALLLLVLLPIKGVLFFRLFARFRERARNSFLTSVSLTHYSEFGLIVMAICVSKAWLPVEWLVIMSLAVALSFLTSSLLNLRKHRLYSRMKLHETATSSLDAPLPSACVREAQTLVVGLGRIGAGAFETLTIRHGKDVWGIDFDKDVVDRLQARGWQVLLGDGEDPDFWAQIGIKGKQLVMLALPNLKDVTEAIRQIRQAGYAGQIASVTHFESDRQALEDAGSDVIFYIYDGVGAGFAEYTLSTLTRQETA